MAQHHQLTQRKVCLQIPFSLVVRTLSLEELGGEGGGKEMKTLLKKRKFSKLGLPHSCWTGY